MPSDDRLTVAISTIGARAGRIVLPDPSSEIDYLILLQRPDAAPLLFPRADLTLQPLGNLGTAASRNAAIDHARGTFLLFTDDDVTFDTGGIVRLRDVLRADPGLAIVTGLRTGRIHTARTAGYRLRHWNTARTATPEIMVRLAPIRDRGIRFDPEFGIGGRYGLGDEFVFLTDALKAGLKGRHEPVPVGHHEGASTGDRWNDPTLIQARIAVMTRVFGRAAPLARLAFALKNRHHLRDVSGGVTGFVLGRETPPERRR